MLTGEGWRLRGGGGGGGGGVGVGVGGGGGVGVGVGREWAWYAQGNREGETRGFDEVFREEVDGR